MENNEIVKMLERIAIALERIADSGNINKSIKNLIEPNDIFSKESEIQNKETDTGEATFENHLDVIKEFLNTRNIQIKTVPPEDAADDIINSLSEFLGKNYDGLRELLIKIKRSMQQGYPITLSIKDYSQKDVSNVCQFATRLYEIAFLEQYKYFKSPQYLIKAKTTTLPAAQNFFSGIWLERFVLLSVQMAVNLVSQELDKELEFAYLLNPQVILPNGDDFELDLIFYVNDSFYWIEAKSGDYQQHISKYSKISRLLNLDFKHSIMVLTDITAEKSGALTSLFSMTVNSLSQLEEMLIETIKEDQIA
jgi:hypothetical protein